MTSDAEIRALIEQVAALLAMNRTGQVSHPLPGLAVELLQRSQSALSALLEERESLGKQLRTVQNAAKTIASAQGTELEHLRQNRTYDHRLRSQHESLMERDAQMTDALLAAEARITDLEAKLAKARAALEPFDKLAAEVFRDGMNKHRADNEGIWGFDNTVLSYGDLRRARSTLEAL